MAPDPRDHESPRAALISASCSSPPPPVPSPSPAQSSCIKIWGGKEEKYAEAQAQLLARAKANSEASVGKYVPGSQPSIEQSLFVKNYAY